MAVITNALDTRYGERQCVTHCGGYKRAALPVRDLMSLRHPSTSDCGFDLDQFDVVAVDESQFFQDFAEFCMHAVEERHKTVIAAGLSGDYKRNQFGDIVKLVPFADQVSFLKARCCFCEEPAAFTLRLVANAEQELVGGKDEYQPVCRHHYRNLSNVAEEFEP